jgi:hypothetical protein
MSCPSFAQNLWEDIVTLSATSIRWSVSGASVTHESHITYYILLMAYFSLVRSMYPNFIWMQRFKIQILYKHPRSGNLSNGKELFTIYKFVLSLPCGVFNLGFIACHINKPLAVVHPTLMHDLMFDISFLSKNVKCFAFSLLTFLACFL